MALKTFRGRKDGNSLKSQVKEGKIEQRVTVLLARVLGGRATFPRKINRHKIFPSSHLQRCNQADATSIFL